MIRHIGFAMALAATCVAHSGPAAAQSRDFCVMRMPFPPVPPATQSKLVVYQAYAVPLVGSSSTVFSYHAQVQNQSAGTVTMTVNIANLPAVAGGRWAAGVTSLRLTSYQPIDIIIAKLTVSGKTNTIPVDPWTILDSLVRQCPFSK